MPKIGKKFFSITGRGDDYEIHYTRKELFSIKGLPKEFTTITQFETHGYDTENSLIMAVHDAIKKYMELTKTERTSILFRAVASYDLALNKTGDGAYSGHKSGVSKYVSSMGMGSIPQYAMGFEYHIVKVVGNSSTEKDTYYRLNEDLELESTYAMSASDKNYREIPYSTSTIALFKELADAFQNAVYKISKIMDADIKELESAYITKIFIEDKKEGGNNG